MNISDRRDPDFTVPRCQHNGILNLPPAVGRFVAAVDALIDTQLPDDKIQARLERVLRNIEHSELTSADQCFDNSDCHDLHDEELAQYGYHILQMWLRIVVVWTRASSAIGEQRVDLRDGDIDELAKEAVARGIHSFQDETPRSGQWADAAEVRMAFLVHCVRQLPHAYRSAVDPLEEELAGRATGAFLIRCLRYCVTDWCEHTTHLLQSWGYGRQKSNEIIRITLKVLDLALRRYAELADPLANVRSDGGQVMDR